MSIRSSVSEALEPYVGSIVADTCVRATALSLGKTSDEFDAADLPAITRSVRHLLAPVAAPAAIENVVHFVEQSVMVGVGR